MNSPPERPVISFAALRSFFSDADEIVFQLHFGLDEERIAALCREARHRAHLLRQHFGSRTAEEVARVYGIEVIRDRWQTGEGIVYLAECMLHPPKIRLNLDAIESLAEIGRRRAGEGDRQWFAESRIIEAVTAHELYHIIRQHPSSPSIELAAHCFAREFAGLPFSALLYEVLLRLRKTGQ
jgi:hypothetical protein